ncbi:MAG: 2-amino-4-hydroxy-6-hydroxymethyldihydropteridine diphosphokinase [Acidobacteria bacterium]|nr:2-amino-4-hydroxy-6-hydroxymethyldihydropteridine diphosphokinase [Acidobacteriota bacterium]
MPAAPITAYLSLGSNVGDRMGNLLAALKRIGRTTHSQSRTSSVFETEPVDHLDQPWFLNCVAEISTTLSPAELLHQLQKIELQLGRERTVPPLIPKGPRTLDIDILLYGDLILQSEELTIPHPRMMERRFVLQPLCELAPHLLIPGTSQTVASTLAQLPLTPTVRLYRKSLDI